MNDGTDDESTSHRHDEDGVRLPRSSKSEKTIILDDLVSLTGWHRDYARHSLVDADTIKLVTPRRARAP
jgi:hypothetical protein